MANRPPRSGLALRDDDKGPQSSVTWIRNELPLPFFGSHEGRK
jgi:hypothetical protein